MTDMPVFAIKAQDVLAPRVIDMYAALCVSHGLEWQAGQARLAACEVRQWQADNPDRVKIPDHAHVPTG